MPFKDRSDRNKLYYQNNKAKERNRQLERLYGITLEDYKIMFNKQDGCCAICKRHQVEVIKTLCVDHDHATGKIRKLLCHDCNKGLGHFKDSPELLDIAFQYLMENK